MGAEEEILWGAQMVRNWAVTVGSYLRQSSTRQAAWHCLNPMMSPASWHLLETVGSAARVLGVAPGAQPKSLILPPVTS